MLTRRTLAALAAVMILLAGCSKPATTEPQAGTVPPVLKWTGSALEGGGITFYQRRLANVVVHYAPLTTPEQAERIAETATNSLRQLRESGKCCTDQTVHIWVVPLGHPWPEGVPRPIAGFRALGGGHLLTHSTPDWATAPLLGPMLVTMQLPEGHPALAEDWFTLGQGWMLEGSLDRLPSMAWRYWTPSREGLGALATPGNQQFVQVSVNLAALLADQRGITWPLRYSGEWTPEALLLWATGADDVDTAFKRWSERTLFIRSAHRSILYGRYWVTTARDTSPLRMNPQLAQLPPGPGPEANRSPHRYAIDARYDPAAATISGTTRLTWQNGEGIPVDRLYFNLWPNAEQFAYVGGSMAVSGVAVNGQPAGYQAEGLDLAVSLPAAVAPGGEAEVTIDFLTRLPPSLKGPQLGQHGAERFQLAYWHPQLAVLDDRGWHLTALPFPFGDPYAEHAGYTVRLEVPTGTAMAAAGKLAGREELADRWVYQFTADHLTHFAAYGGTAETELVRQVGPVTVRVMHPDKARAADLMAEAERSLRLFADLYGPYPYPELVVGFGARTALPGVIGLAYMDGGDNWRGQLWQVMAHQWFGVTVGNDQWGEPWLDEGFARYGARKAMRAFGQTQLLTDLNRVAPLEGQRVNSSTTTFLRYGGYVEGAQETGARVLEELESLLGPAAMNHLMRTWVEQYRFRTPTTADFIAHAEAVAGRPLDQFFADRHVDPAAREPYQPAQPLGKMIVP